MDDLWPRFFWRRAPFFRTQKRRAMAPCVLADLGSSLEEDRDVLREKDVGVQDDRAFGDLPGVAVRSQDVLAVAGVELLVGLQVRSVHQERTLGPDFAVLAA